MPKERRTCASAAKGRNRSHVDAVGNHADLVGRKMLDLDQMPRMGLGHADERIGPAGQEPQRLSRPIVSGQPVECRAEQITGTPASRAAIRPQNILSPAPTVTTASIR